jgi:hypothetical protein
MIVKIKCSYFVTFINLFGHFCWKDSKSKWPYFSRLETAFKRIWCSIVQGSRLWYWPLSGGRKN